MSRALIASVAGPGVVVDVYLDASGVVELELDSAEGFARLSPQAAARVGSALTLAARCAAVPNNTPRPRGGQ